MKRLITPVAIGRRSIYRCWNYCANKHSPAQTIHHILIMYKQLKVDLISAEQLEHFLIMTQTQFDKLYTAIYEAYELAGLKDEYVRSTLGDALDHMILLKQQKLICPDHAT
jgi:transcriptional regulator of acetoin/glycerol metabolism